MQCFVAPTSNRKWRRSETFLDQSRDRMLSQSTGLGGGVIVEADVPDRCACSVCAQINRHAQFCCFFSYGLGRVCMLSRAFIHFFTLKHYFNLIAPKSRLTEVLKMYGELFFLLLSCRANTVSTVLRWNGGTFKSCFNWRRRNKLRVRQSHVLTWRFDANVTCTSFVSKHEDMG